MCIVQNSLFSSCLETSTQKPWYHFTVPFIWSVYFQLAPIPFYTLSSMKICGKNLNFWRSAYAPSWSGAVLGGRQELQQCPMELISDLRHSVWKSQKKSHSTLRAKRATITFWFYKNSLKVSKIDRFCEFLGGQKPAVKQCYQTGHFL